MAQGFALKRVSTLPSGLVARGRRQRWSQMNGCRAVSPPYRTRLTGRLAAFLRRREYARRRIRVFTHKIHCNPYLTMVFHSNPWLTMGGDGTRRAVTLRSFRSAGSSAEATRAPVGGRAAWTAQAFCPALCRKSQVTRIPPCAVSSGVQAVWSASFPASATRSTARDAFPSLPSSAAYLQGKAILSSMPIHLPARRRLIAADNG